jgi:anti-anti-sigma regulatory factor
MNAQLPKTKVEHVGDATQVTICSREAVGEESLFAETLRGLAETSQPKHLIVDLSELYCLNSSEIGSLIGLTRNLRASGRTLTLLVGAHLYELFKRTRLTTWMDVRLSELSMDFGPNSLGSVR